MPLAPADRSKLAGVLALLGSPHAGERDAAALAADRLVRGRGLSWRDVLCGTAARSPPAPTTWQADLALCRLHIDVLTAWESEFVLSLSGRRRSVSPAQQGKLAEIATALRSEGPRAR